MLNKRTYSGNTPQTHNRTAYPHYRPAVVVACFTYEPLRYAIAAVVPGQVYQHRVGGDPRTPLKRSQWTYRWNVSQIVEYLPQVLPWLVIKQEQARLLLRATKIKHSYVPGSRERDAEFRASLDEIYLSIRRLNTRGRTALVEGGDAE